MKNLNFCSIDFETANRSPDSACAVGLVRVEGGKVAGRLSLLLRPPSDEFEFTYIHGLSWDDVRRSPSFGDVWNEMAAFAGTSKFFAAHNAPFDRGVLEACCAGAGIKPPKLEWVNTVTVARQVWSIFPTKLSDVSAKLSIPLNHHEALSDANACAQIVIQAWEKGWRR